MILALTGTDLDAKAALVERFVHRYAEAVDGLDAVAIDRIGQAQHDPDSQNAGTELLRITVQGTKQAAGRAFSSRMVELALSSYPGLYSLGPPQPGSAFGVYWPALLDQRMLQHMVHHYDGTTEIIAPGNPHDAGGEVTPQAEPPLRHRCQRRGQTNSSSPHSVRSCMPAPATRAATRISASGYATVSMGLAQVDPHRRRTPTPSSRNTRTGDLALRTPQPRRGQLPRPRTARDRRHLDTAAGLAGKALGEWLRSRSTKVPRSLLNTSGAHW